MKKVDPNRIDPNKMMHPNDSSIYLFKNYSSYFKNL